MDEVSVEAKVADEGVAPPLVVAVPRLEVQRAIDEEQEADLVLDVVRTNGQREERRVHVALDEETLRRLIEDQGGEQILVAFDPESLAASFDDVDAHGLREVGATLAVAIAAVGAGAGAAGAEGLQPALSTNNAVQATAPSDAGMPRAMPSDYAAQQGDESVTLRRDPGAMPTGAAISEPTERGIENVRASQPPPAEASDATSGIESVRVGGTAVPDPSSGIEAVRAERAPAGGGDGGITIAAPGTGAAVAIAGGAMLTIAAAAFALRRKREPRLA
jgi:hypothetical protein